MATFIAAFIVLLLIVAAMSIGVLMGRPPIKGSCGGLNNGTGDSSCQLCGGDPVKCEDTEKAQAS